MDPTVLERLSRRPVRTAEYVEPRADINRYRVGSSNTAARGRPLANPSSAVRSEPAWSFSIEERPKAGKPSAWKMEQPREGVRLIMGSTLANGQCTRSRGHNDSYRLLNDS